MAGQLGVDYRETLTSFKWIANAALDHGGSMVVGYEEALGYSIGNLVRDKDGVSAADSEPFVLVRQHENKTFHKTRKWLLTEQRALPTQR